MTRPSSRKIRQSAAFWFQPASCESAIAARKSLSPNSRAEIPGGNSRLETAIATIVMRFLAQTAHPAGDPIGHPIDHARKRDGWIPEKTMRLGRIDQPTHR